LRLRQYAAEIGEDEAFQRRMWRAERIGWAVVALILLAALTGVFSGGLLGRATARDPGGGLSVEYDRFARYGAPTTILIRLEREAGGEATLRLSRSLLEAFAIARVRPRPEREWSQADGLAMRVRLDAGGVLELSGKAGGRLLVNGEIALEGEAPARLQWLIWP
jgi:hypothetical protein